MKRLLLILAALMAVGIAPVQTVRGSEPVYHMTLSEYQKTVAHEAALKQERIDELQKALNDLQTTRDANASTAALVPDLNRQIDGLNSQIGAWKRKDFLDKWKFSIIGLFIGLAVAIGTAYAAKMGLLGASTAEKLVTLAAKA